MNAVARTTAFTNGPASPAPTSASAPAVVAPSLLADPVPSALAGADPLSMLYLFESKDQELGFNEGVKKITALQTERHQALQQEQQAIKQAADAANNHSFWDDLGSICGEVAKVAGIVASIAASVVTFGAATPIAALAIAAVVLSTASFADGEFHVLHSLGVDDKTAGWIDTGMSFAGAALSFGAGLGGAASSASRAVSALSQVGNVAAGVATIGRGASAIEAGEAQAATDQAAADEVAASARSAHAQRLIQTVIDDTQSADQQSQHITRTIASTKTILNDTALTAATAVRG